MLLMRAARVSSLSAFHHRNLLFAMLAITLGYTESGRTAAPIHLYAGNDAGEAEKIFTNPPAGIFRTELFKNPTPTRRRTIPEVPAPAPVLEELPAAPAPEELPPVEPAAEVPAEKPAEELLPPPASTKGKSK